jgi:MFS family permease
MFALATGSTVFNPAIQALGPEITPPAHLTTAATIFQISEFSALVVGPVLAAMVIPHFGTIHLFTLDSLTFFVSAAFLVALPRPIQRLRRERVDTILAEVKSGIAAVLATPILRALLILGACNNLVIMGLAHVATPLLVKETLGLDAAAYAQAQTFFFLGMALASAMFWVLGRRAPKGPTILIGIVLDGLTFIPLAFCETLGQVQTALFIHGLCIPMILIPRTVLVQEVVPWPLHGRAFSLINVTVFGMMAISSGIVGLLAEAVRPQILFAVLGVVGALPGLAGFGLRALASSR